MGRGIDRRDFLGSPAAGVLLALSQAPAVLRAQPRFDRTPFSLGVASGDPQPDGFVIWTRLAPRPLEALGGLPPESVEVKWEVAEDQQFNKIVRRGTALATPQLAHSVHVELTGLRPDRAYWYRFHSGGATSPLGRSRTTPGWNARAKELHFAFASCQHYEHGYYAAFRHMASLSPQLIVHLGDYIYEGTAGANGVRRHRGKECETLEDYRQRYALYKTDSDLQTAHASCPWLVSWDDHEFDNNYAGSKSEQRGIQQHKFLARRAAAYQAFYEHMPLRRRSIPRGPHMKIYQRVRYGRLANFFVLDTRQYRTDQPNGDGLKPLEGAVFDPQGTILGHKQRDWLQAGLLQSQSRWNVLAQQVLMARIDRIPGDEDLFAMDKWSGYDVERQGLMDFLHTRKVPNPIVLSGDIHTNFVNDLKLDYDDEKSATIGTEFVGTSISSGGNGSQKLSYTDGMMAENPSVRFHNAERGYVSCRLTNSRWQSDYWVVQDVTKPDSKVLKRAGFVVESGRPGVKRDG